MQLFFDWGVAFIDGLSSIGDFLYSTPFASWADVILENESAWAYFPFVNDFLYWLAYDFCKTPLALVLVGTGLVGLLTFKAVKFVVGFFK